MTAEERGEKLLGAIGLARKAGKCLIGTELIVDAMRAGKGKLLLIASDASEATKKKLTDTAKSHSVPFGYLDSTKATLAARLGKKCDLSGVLVTDDGFVCVIRKTEAQIQEYS